MHGKYHAYIIPLVKMYHIYLHTTATGYVPPKQAVVDIPNNRFYFNGYIYNWTFAEDKEKNRLRVPYYSHIELLGCNYVIPKNDMSSEHIITVQRDGDNYIVETPGIYDISFLNEKPASYHSYYKYAGDFFPPIQDVKVLNFEQLVELLAGVIHLTQDSYVIFKDMNNDYEEVIFHKEPMKTVAEISNYIQQHREISLQYP